MVATSTPTIEEQIAAADRWVEEAVHYVFHYHEGSPLGVTWEGHLNVRTAVRATLRRHAALVKEVEGLRAAVRACKAEFEDMEDRRPVDHFCGECNLGTGPHKRTCAYHQVAALTALRAAEETGNG